MAEKVTLKDATTGVTVYPQTLVDSVQDEAGNLLKTLVLMLNNTTAFTPTGDYNPATKNMLMTHLRLLLLVLVLLFSHLNPQGKKLAIFGIKQHKE